MKDRLQAIINLEKISAAQLAALLGIQRSTLSNILGGRNNPSFEVIQGLLTKLPNLNIEWFLKGEGKPYKNPDRNFRGEGIPGITSEEISDYPDAQADNSSDLFGFERDAKREEEIQIKQTSQSLHPPVQESDTEIIKDKIKTLQNIISSKKEPYLHADKSSSSVKEIILLYKDGTFEIYNNSI